MRFAVGLLVTIIYVPGITGAAIPSGWALLWFAIPLCLIIDCARGRSITATDPHWLGLTFALWCAVSMAWTVDRNGAMLSFFELGAFGITFLWASGLDDARPVYYGLAIGLLINDGIALAQYFLEMDIVGEISRPAGLFVSKNVFGELSALIVIVLAGNGLWRWVPVGLPGIMLTGSRGALLALFSAGFLWLWRWNRRIALLALLAPAIAAGATFALGHRTATLDERWIWTRDTIAALSIQGHGVGSYGSQFPSYAHYSDTSTRRPDHLHDDYLELAFEVGLGIIPLALFFVSCLEGALWAERLVLVAFLLIGLFEMPLHAPAESFVGAVVAGRLARARRVAGRDLGIGGSLERRWLCNSGHHQDRAGSATIPL